MDEEIKIRIKEDVKKNRIQTLKAVTLSFLLFLVLVILSAAFMPTNIALGFIVILFIIWLVYLIVLTVKQTKNIKKFNNEIIEEYDTEEREDENIALKELNNQRQKMIWSNPIFVTLMVIGLWPLGLYLMWKYKVFNKIARILITVVIAIIVSLKILSLVTGA